MQYVIQDEHCYNINNVLVIEDSLLLQHSIQSAVTNSLKILCDSVSTEKEAKEKLSSKNYDLVISDIYLPDSTGNFIGYLIRKKQKIIVITASNNEEERQKLVRLPIIDYVYKTDEKSILNYILDSIKRLQSNLHEVIGICDASHISRLRLKQLVINQNLPYIELKDGLEAYSCIKEKQISFLITDVNMPKMNGIELIRQSRLLFSNGELPILALSESTKTSLVAELLKTGANDYISKPLNNEEFLTRLNLLLDNSRLYKYNIELIYKLQKLSTTDYLTSLFNRNYFHSVIKYIQSKAKREQSNYGIIMIDIDFFKKINDNYGHDTGDITLKTIANILTNTSRDSDIICRWGGEEFLILVPNSSIEELVILSERIRKKTQNIFLITNDNTTEFQITLSAGVSLSEDSNCMNVDDVIQIADERLYKAKNSGRNCVVFK